jgi:hypothetical protein
VGSERKTGGIDFCSGWALDALWAEMDPGRLTWADMKKQLSVKYLDLFSDLLQPIAASSSSTKP